MTDLFLFLRIVREEKMIERLEVYLRKVLSHYADFNAETMKWEITFDELNEMIQFYLDKYWEEKTL